MIVFAARQLHTDKNRSIRDATRFVGRMRGIICGLNNDNILILNVQCFVRVEFRSVESMMCPYV